MPASRARLFNTLTLALLILTALLCAAYAAIFALAPPQDTAALATGTPDPTGTPTRTPTASKTLRPTNTATHTPPPSPTFTDTPVITQTVTGTRTPSPTVTPGPSPTPSRTLAPFNYVVRRLEYTRSIHGSNWAGVAGLVFGLDRKHQTNILVRVQGDAPIGPQGEDKPSGIAPQYGVSGFEFTLGDRPLVGKWTIQLIGDDGLPLSDAILIEMGGDPRANLAYIEFEQNH